VDPHAAGADGGLDRFAGGATSTLSRLPSNSTAQSN
jgi:hypothetical protein